LCLGDRTLRLDVVVVLRCIADPEALAPEPRLYGGHLRRRRGEALPELRRCQVLAVRGALRVGYRPGQRLGAGGILPTEITRNPIAADGSAAPTRFACFAQPGALPCSVARSDAANPLAEAAPRTITATTLASIKNRVTLPLPLETTRSARIWVHEGCNSFPRFAADSGRTLFSPRSTRIREMRLTVVGNSPQSTVEPTAQSCGFASAR
jgi:hypothetical protein